MYTADVVVALPSEEPLTEQHPMASWLKAITSSRHKPNTKSTNTPSIFLTLVDGHSQSKTDADLFTVDGKTLRGYQGLPAYIPHLTFDRLGSTIQQYMTCLVNTSIQDGSAAQNLRSKQSRPPGLRLRPILHRDFRLPRRMHGKTTAMGTSAMIKYWLTLWLTAASYLLATAAEADVQERPQRYVE